MLAAGCRCTLVCVEERFAGGAGESRFMTGWVGGRKATAHGEPAWTGAAPLWWRRETSGKLGQAVLKSCSRWAPPGRWPTNRDEHSAAVENDATKEQIRRLEERNAVTLLPAASSSREHDRIGSCGSAGPSLLNGGFVVHVLGPVNGNERRTASSEPPPTRRSRGSAVTACIVLLLRDQAK